MSKMKLFLTVLLVSALTFTSAMAKGAVDTGGQAPDFKLENLKGDPINLNSFKGNKAVLLVFWATWCPFCREEIPQLKNIYSQYQSKGLEILAISIKESKEKLASFAQQNDISYPILMDKDGSVSAMYQVVGIPTNIIIDKQGVIQFKGNSLPKDYTTLLDKAVK